MGDGCELCGVAVSVAEGTADPGVFHLSLREPSSCIRDAVFTGRVDEMVVSNTSSTVWKIHYK